MAENERQAGAEVEVTEEMIAAGVNAFAESGLEIADAQTAALVCKAIREVFLAMALAQTNV